MPSASYFLADDEAGDVLEEDERNAPLGTQLDKVCSLQRAFGEEDAVIGEDADGHAVNMGEAADQGLAEPRLELVQSGSVDQTRDDLADVIGG